MKLQIKRSNVLEEGEAKAPALEQMEYGELAVNYNSTDPVIFIRDSDDNIIRLTNIRPIGDGAINVDAGTGIIASGSNATANQISNTTRTLAIDSTWLIDFVNANGNGAININAGPGLEASGSNATANQSGDTTRVLSAKIDPNGGLQVTGSGIAIESIPDSGINIDSNGIAVVADPDGGLEVNSSGIAAVEKVNGGISADSSGISVEVNPTGGIKTDAAGTAVKIDDNGGLKTNAAGTSVKVDPTGGITTTSSGTAVKVNPSGGIKTDANGTSVKVDPNGGLKTTTDGTAVLLKSGGGLVVDGGGVGVEFPPFPEPTYGDGLKIENNQIDLVLSPSNNGLRLDSTGLSVRIDPGWGIDVTSTGIRFGNDWTNIPELI